MGLRTSSNSPCLFIGHLIPGEPSMYVGIYVDDIIYFSLSAFEKQFELSLSTIGNVDFMGKFPIFWVLNLLGKLALTVTFVLALLNNPLLTLYLTSWVFWLTMYHPIVLHIFQVSRLIPFLLLRCPHLTETNYV